MAGRKAEPGISYYKMNCGHTINKKVRLLFNEFDANGYWIWQCIIDYAYSHKGYYFDCNDPDALELFATDVCKKQVSLVNEVIDGCLRRGLFSKTVFEMFGILSSVMMQDIYLDATYERRRKGTEIELYDEFVLVDIPADAVNISIVPWNKSILPRKNDNVPGSNATDKSIVKKSKAEKSIVESPNGVGNSPVANVPQEPQELFKKIEKNKTECVKFIRQYKPDFIEPYAELWNIFADEKKLAKIQKITDTRKKKFRVRISEKCFDFLEILKKASQSQFLLTEKWFCFDWIVENESNYLKVIEGNYDKKTPGVNSKNDTPDKFTIALTQGEKQINSLYSIFLSGKLKVSDMYDTDYDFLVKRGMKISGAQTEKIRESVREYVQAENLENSENTFQSLLKRFAVIEHFKTLKQKGNVAVFRMD